MIRTPAPVAVLPLLFFLASGCTTPPETLDAARAQVQLVEALDEATRKLQAGFDQFHRDREELLRTQARVLVARQAINVLVPDPTKADTTTVTAVFTQSNDHIRPWVDNALRLDVLREGIAALQSRLNTRNRELEELERDLAIPTMAGREKRQQEHDRKKLVSLQWESQILALQQVEEALKAKPEMVNRLEEVLSEDLTAERDLRGSTNATFDHLRKQLAVMKVMASRVHDWLSIDVTVSQEQAAALDAAIGDVIAAFKPKEGL